MKVNTIRKSKNSRNNSGCHLSRDTVDSEVVLVDIDIHNTFVWG